MASRDFIRQFIAIYKSSPNLWDKQNSEYMNRNCRETSYKKLLKLSRKYYSEADHHWVTNKIQNLRTSFYRERKKVLWQRHCGGPEYVVLLWYYNLISFIDQECYQELNEAGKVSDDDLDDRHKSESDTDLEQDIEVKQEPNTTPEKRRNKKRKLTSDNDVYQLIAEYWSSKMKDLEQVQRVFAEGLINSVLKKAALNELTRDTILAEKQ